MIHHLTLNNFRKHRHLDLDFSNGLQMLVGPNWAGKTAVLSAISFALFGTRAAPGKAEDLITWGERDMSVSLTFSGARGEVMTVSRGPKSATLTTPEGVIATGNSAVTAEIEAQIGVEARDFLAFNLTRQADADALLLSNSTKMSEYVARITGIDVVDGTLDKIKAEATLCTGALSALPDLSTQLKELHEQSSEASLQLLLAQSQEVEAQADSEAVKARLKELTANAGQLRAEFTASEQSRRQMTLLEGAYAGALQALEQAKASAKPRPEQSVDVLTNHLALAAQALKDQVALAEAQNNVRMLQYELGEMPEAEELEKLVSEYRGGVARESELSKKLDQAIDALNNSMCMYCMRPFEGEDIERHTAEKDRLARELVVLREALDDLEASAMAAQTALSARGDVATTLRQWEAYSTAVAVQLEGAPTVDAEAVGRLSEEVSALEGAWREHRDSERFLRQGQEAVDRTKQALEGCLVSQGPSLDEVICAEAQASQASESAWKVHHREQELRTRVASISSAMAALRGSITAAELGEAKRHAALGRADKLKALGKFLRDNRDGFTSAFWEQMLGYASQLINEATSGDVTKLSRDAAGDFLYTEAGRDTRVEGNASGMQRAIFSTAIKLSLAAALGNPFPVMLFDEVTAAATDENSLLLTSLLARAGKQVVMVTHRQSDAAVADCVICLD